MKFFINKNVFFLFVCQALSGTVISLVTTSTAVAARNLLENKSLSTLPYSIQFIGMMITSGAASSLMRREGRQLGFQVGALILCIGGLLTMLALYQTNFFLFCFASLFIGSFNAFAMLYRFAAAEVVSEPLRSRAISLVLSGGLVASFVGPALASGAKDFFPNTLFFGSYSILIVVGVLTVLALLFIDVPQSKALASTEVPRSLKQIAAQPEFMVGWICSVIGYATMTILMTATPLAMVDNGHSFHDSAHVIQWHVFGMFAPALIMGHLIKRFGNLQMMLVGIVLMFACICINLSGESVVHFWSALFVLGLGWCSTFIGSTHLLTFCYNGSEKAKVQSLVDTTLFSFVAAGSLSSGLIQSSFGWRALNYIAVPGLVIALIVILRLLWQKRKKS